MSLKIDQYELVIAGDDSADSCQRSYSVLLLKELLTRKNINFNPISQSANLITYENTKTHLEVTPGIYIRNPVLPNTKTVSRDQLTPVICYLATMANSSDKTVASSAKADLSNLLIACLKRGMFAQNNQSDTGTMKIPDFINPDLWAIFASGYVRTLWAPLAILIILLGDVFAVLSATIKCFFPKNADGGLSFRFPGPNDVDDTNANNCHMTRQWNFGTPLSWLARKIYKTFRHSNYGVTQLHETSNVMGAIAWYNRNDNTDITELSRPLVGEY